LLVIDFLEGVLVLGDVNSCFWF